MRKRNLRLLSLVCLACMLLPCVAQARTPYKTFTVNGYGEMQETQTAYTVKQVLSLDEVIVQANPDLEIEEVDDLYIDEDGILYVAAVLWDNFEVASYGAVLVINAGGQMTDVVRIGGSSRAISPLSIDEMSGPRGVFKAANGHLYAADPDARLTVAAAANIHSLTFEPSAAPAGTGEEAENTDGAEQRAEAPEAPTVSYDSDTDQLTLIDADGNEYTFERDTAANEVEREADAAEEAGESADTAEAREEAAAFTADTVKGPWAAVSDGALTGDTLVMDDEGYVLALNGETSAGAWSVARVSRTTLVGAVFEFDEGYRLVHAYIKPENPLYGASTAFKPMKVAVNQAGILYIICDGNANGIVEISPGEEEDAFLGYFGTNYASVGVWDIFLRSIRTAEQRAMSGNSTNPRSPTNLDVDDRGLIYTVTQGDGRSTLKRLNIAGSNLISDAMSIDKPAGVAAGLDDNVYVADEDGFIYEFNSVGELIFVFGGKDNGTSRAGLFTKVSAIDVAPNGHLHVLDSTQRTITVFEPTEFTTALHEALGLYGEGRYTESKEPLETVLDMNSMFDVANKAMGRAYFQEENYDEALRYARLAKDKDGYSDAYWEVRNVWLKRNISIVFIVVIAITLLWWIMKRLDRKFHFLDKLRPRRKREKRGGYLSNLRYSFYYMRHPIDGSYGIAREGRASWAVSLTLLLVFIVEFLINKYFCGFLQKAVQDGRYEIFSDVGMVLAAAVGLVGCNYLVCTINEGEGTVKKIASYFCYSLTPYIILTPVIFLLSQVLTQNEQFLITLVQVLAYAWMAVILVLGIREVNNYTGKQTAKVIVLTLFTLLILALIIFILYVLWAQVFKFIGEIYGEVVYRVG